MSYTRPQGDLLLVRDGCAFTVITPEAADTLRKLEQDAAIVLDLVKRLDRPSKNTLELVESGLSRTRLRMLVNHLLGKGALTWCEERKKGGTQKYLVIGEPWANLGRT